jgi:hypothetical protein
VKRSLGLALLACSFVLAPIGAHATASGPVGPIVYVDDSGDIAVVDADGSDQVSSNVSGSSPTWAPGSAEIAYIAGNEIRRMSYPGFDDLGAVPNTTGAEEVAYGPNGQTLAYSDGDNVFTIDPDGSDQTQLTTGTAHNTDPTWSPDSAEIAFTSDRDGNLEIYKMAASNGANQMRLTNSTHDDRNPSWSPDGTTIAFDSDRDDPGATFQIYRVADTGTSSEIRVSSDSSDDSDPSWSPDGTQLVIVSDTDLATISKNGTSASALSPATPGTSPEWGLLFGPLTVPTISPSSGLAEGVIVTASNGTWTSSPTSYGYQWQRCNSVGASCASISGATSQTYTVTSSDNGFTLRVAVTATASSGSGTSTSGATSLIQQATSVAGLEPTIVEVPTIFVTPPSGQAALDDDGKVLVGSLFRTGLGTWRGQFPLTYKYQWKKCDAKGDCYTIPSATASTFQPTIDLFGWRIAATVIATNAISSTESTSKPSGVLTAAAPHGTDTPAITGQNVVGQSLSVATGTFTGTAPFSYSYVWRRCDAPGTLPSCVAIPGATSSSYTLQQADLGATIRAYVTATNVMGSDTLITNHTFPTLPKPRFAPTASVAPTMLGNPLPGLSLTASLGTWSGDAPIKLTLQWQRCDATGSKCTAIKGATKRTLAVTTKYAGSRLRFVVTAKNEVGTATTISPVTEAIRLIPHRKGRTIRGTRKADYLAGGGFDDTISGLGGNDTIVGGAGADRILGGAGNDVITGGAGRDRISGQAGSDTIMAADGDRDTVDCGAGSDRAVVDGIDLVVNCEAVQVAAGTTTPAAPTTTTTPATTTTTPAGAR